MPPVTVSVAGLTVTPAGSPLKVNCTVALKPPVEVDPTLMDWVVPPVSIIGEGATTTAKPAPVPEPPQPVRPMKPAARTIKRLSSNFRMPGTLMTTPKASVRRTAEQPGRQVPGFNESQGPFLLKRKRAIGNVRCALEIRIVAGIRIAYAVAETAAFFATFRRVSALSVSSQWKSFSLRPKWP